MARIPGLIGIHHKILQLLRDNPGGLTVYEIREMLPEIGVQQHLDKRVRELRYFYALPIHSRHGKDVYVLGEARSDAVLVSSGRISGKTRATVLHSAHGRCQMCGSTVADDRIKLQVDHKVPRNWGGTDDIGNLWALCQLCNGGKRDFFATFDDAEMNVVLRKESVYERIAETLRLHLGKPTPSWLLEFVANAGDWQEDWQKRLRELRYPPIGFRIVASRTRGENGRWVAAYRLDEWKELPPDHKFLIKEYERARRHSPPKTELPAI